MKRLTEHLTVTYNVVGKLHIVACPTVTGIGATFHEAREDFEKKFNAWMFNLQVPSEAVSENPYKN